MQFGGLLFWFDARLVYRGVLAIYALPCLLQVAGLYYFLRSLDRDVLDYNLQLKPDKISFELYSMLGARSAGAETAVIRVSDGGLFTRLTGFGANKTQLLNES